MIATMRWASASTAVLACVCACREDSSLLDQTTRLTLDQIVASGHKTVYDKALRPIALNARVVEQLQTSALRELEKCESCIDDPAVREGMRILEDDGLEDLERMLLRSVLIRKELERAPDAVRRRYRNANDVLLEPAFLMLGGRSVAIQPRVRSALSALVPNASAVTTDDNYVFGCRALGVPVPPPFWSSTGTEWVFQGTLTQNMLHAGFYAEVWTYADPKRRGACIALPRTVGPNKTDEDDVLGIICQSAVTGYACFWDNLSRSAPREPWEPPPRIDFQKGPVLLADMQNATELPHNCTACHYGSNVFLIAPDDPTWAKVLRGPLDGQCSDCSRFTTQVEPLPGKPGERRRYTPFSGSPPREGWINKPPFPVYRQCDRCHEDPGGPELAEFNRKLLGVTVFMPPVCGESCRAPKGPTCACSTCRCPDAASCSNDTCVCNQPSLIVCGNACVTPNTAQHCTGDDGCVPCPKHGSCTNGLCTCPTSAPHVCSGECVSFDSETHCGGCGRRCPPTAHCKAGACVCPAGASLCGDRCIVGGNDPQNCGACGRKCGEGQDCKNGQCECPKAGHDWCECAPNRERGCEGFAGCAPYQQCVTKLCPSDCLP